MSILRVSGYTCAGVSQVFLRVREVHTNELDAQVMELGKSAVERKNLGRTNKPITLH
jgi:hypothetical protein